MCVCGGGGGGTLILSYVRWLGSNVLVYIYIYILGGACGIRKINIYWG